MLLQHSKIKVNAHDKVRFVIIAGSLWHIVGVVNTIVRLLVATLHEGMTGKQDGGYTQLT